MLAAIRESCQGKRRTRDSLLQQNNATPADGAQALETLFKNARPVTLAEEGSLKNVLDPSAQLEVALSQGKTVSQACKQLEVTEQAYYRWRKEYGGLRMDQTKRLRELERENARLKRRVADQALDNSMLREDGSGNF